MKADAKKIEKNAKGDSWDKLGAPSLRVKTAFCKTVERLQSIAGVSDVAQWQAVAYNDKINKIYVRSPFQPKRSVVDAVAAGMRDALGYPCQVEFVVENAETDKNGSDNDKNVYINPNVIPGLSDYEGLRKIFFKIRGVDEIYSKLKLTPFSSNNDKVLKQAQTALDENVFKEIAEIACRVFGVTEKELFSPLRTRRTFKARQAVALFLRGNFNLSFKKIGSLLRRDHSSIIYMTQSEKEIPKFLESESFLDFLSKAKDVTERYMS